MPSCSIVRCSARKNKDYPKLTLHRFPKNELMKKKWIEAIGQSNINRRHRERFVCSLHFEKTCFNTTLDVVRLRDASIPSIFRPATYKKGSPILSKGTNLQLSDPLRLTLEIEETSEKASGDQEPYILSEKSNLELSDPLQLTPKIEETLCEQTSSKEETSILSAKDNAQQSKASPSELTRQIVDTAREKVIQAQKIKKLTEKCIQQRKIIKRLHEQVRHRNVKIAKLKDTLEDIRNKYKKNVERAVWIEE